MSRVSAVKKIFFLEAMIVMDTEIPSTYYALCPWTTLGLTLGI